MIKDIILASASPRRRELMEQAGFVFTVIPSQKEETITQSSPEEIVKELSLQKANDVCSHPKEGVLVIGADTIVSFHDQIMGKPKDTDHAYQMLSSLQGQTHQVFTGVTLLFSKNEIFNTLTFSECTDVTMYPMTPKEIHSYIATGEPMDKAGAYGIQGMFAIYIQKINGDYNNVVGLPVARLYQEIKRL